MTRPDIKNRNLEQLKQYAAWEREHFPDDQERIHVLDWAVDEIIKLRAELNGLRSLSNESKKQDHLLSGRILPCKTYTQVGDDMTWPSYDQGDLVGQLIHGTDEEIVASRMRLASIVEAYRQLLSLPQKRRDKVCRAIREAR